MSIKKLSFHPIQSIKDKITNLKWSRQRCKKGYCEYDLYSVSLKIACECRLFIMTDLIGLFRPTPSPAVWDNLIKMVGCFPGFEYGTIIKVKMRESCTREAALNPKLCSSTMFFSFFPCNPPSVVTPSERVVTPWSSWFRPHGLGMYDDVELKLTCELSRSKVH